MLPNLRCFKVQILPESPPYRSIRAPFSPIPKNLLPKRCGIPPISRTYYIQMASSASATYTPQSIESSISAFDLSSKRSLLDLPRELRGLIYEQIFAKTYEHNMSRHFQVPTAQFAILRTCRTINKEASPILFRKGTFRFFSDIHKPALPYSVNQRLADRIQNISVHYSIAGATDFEHSLCNLIEFENSAKRLGVETLKLFANPRVKRESCHISWELHPGTDEEDFDEESFEIDSSDEESLVKCHLMRFPLQCSI